MEDPTLPEATPSAATRMMPTTVKACWKSAGKTPEAGVKEAAQLPSVSGPILNAPLDCATSIPSNGPAPGTPLPARQLSSAQPAAPSLSAPPPEAPTLPFPEAHANSTTGSGCSTGTSLPALTEIPFIWTWSRAMEVPCASRLPPARLSP